MEVKTVIERLAKSIMVISLIATVLGIALLLRDYPRIGEAEGNLAIILTQNVQTGFVLVLQLPIVFGLYFWIRWIFSPKKQDKQ